MYDIRDFEYDQDLFNLTAGTANKLEKGDINAQLMLIQEEVQEIAEALRKGDDVELLDGAIDSLFVVLGLIQKLKMKGFVTYEAMQKVAQNNLSKFPTDPKVVMATIEHYRKQGIKCHHEYIEEYKRYVIRDENNKVRKPVGYESVDLSDCVPKES